MSVSTPPRGRASQVCGQPDRNCRTARGRRPVIPARVWPGSVTAPASSCIPAKACRN